MRGTLILPLAVACSLPVWAGAPTSGAGSVGKPAPAAPVMVAAAKGGKGGRLVRTPKSAPPRKPGKPMAFTPAELDMAPGERYPVELFVPSPSGKAFKGALSFTPGEGAAVKPDPRWNGSLPPWGVETYPTITVAADAHGRIPVEAALANGGKATLFVNVVEVPMEVTTEHAKLKVRVANPYHGRLLTGRVTVSNKDRFLEDVTALEFKAEEGKTAEVVFPLPGAAPVDGTAYDFTFTLETYQGFHTVKTLPLTFPPQEDKTPAGVGK